MAAGIVEAEGDQVMHAQLAHVAERHRRAGGGYPGWEFRGRPITAIAAIGSPHGGSTLKSMASTFHTIRKLVHEPDKRKR